MYIYFLAYIPNFISYFDKYILNCKLSLDLQNVRPSVLPSVPLNLLQFLSNSFNIAHRASLQCRGRHGRNFFFFGSFSGRFQQSLNSFNIAHRTSLQYRERHKRRKIYERVIFGPFSATFRLKKATKSKFVKNGQKNLKNHKKFLKTDKFLKTNFFCHKLVIFGPFLG